MHNEANEEEEKGFFDFEPPFIPYPPLHVDDDLEVKHREEEDDNAWAV